MEKRRVETENNSKQDFEQKNRNGRGATSYLYVKELFKTIKFDTFQMNVFAK